MAWHALAQTTSSPCPLWAQFHYSAELVRLFIRAPSLSDKLRVWWKPPTWYPAALPAPPGPAPVSPSTFRKYEPRVSPRLGRYLGAHYAVVMAIASVALLLAPRLPPVVLVVLSGLVVLSLVSTGALLEGKSWARPLEGVRLVLLAGAVALAVRF